MNKRKTTENNVREKISQKRIKTTTQHPNNVKPLGNYYLENNTEEIRSQGLGFLNSFSDEFIIAIFEEFSPVTLCYAALVSKTFYIFSSIDVLWKPHCIDEFKGDFKFQGTWKKTYAWKKFSHSLCDSVPPINARGLFSDRLYQAWYCAQIDPWIWCKKDNVERRSNLSIEEFKNLYETPNKPVVITDIVTNWTSYSWTREKLIEKYGQIQFRTDFEFTDMKLVDYLLYCGKNISKILS